MTTKKTFLLSCAVLFFLASFAIHKFYVSVTQVDFIENKKRVEITTRIFIDDLEKALEKKSSKKVYLATKDEVPEAKDLIKSYLSQKITASINQKPVSIILLGTEIENDVLICYLKIDFSEKITTFELYNNVLTEIYSDQQNLVHTNINNTKRSFLLTKSDKTALIKY